MSSSTRGRVRSPVVGYCQAHPRSGRSRFPSETTRIRRDAHSPRSTAADFNTGIQGPANATGYLCERADLASFTGDVIAWVKNRIGSASLVIADLTAANPNVYLEVGYAWGRGVRSVLIVAQGDELKFDVRSQRVLVFRSIRHLEELLT